MYVNVARFTECVWPRVAGVLRNNNGLYILFLPPYSHCSCELLMFVFFVSVLQHVRICRNCHFHDHCIALVYSLFPLGPDT